MRLFSALLLILSLALVPAAFAAQKPGAKAPAKNPDAPAEQIYLDVDVAFDEIDHAAYDKDGLPVSGTIQSYYPNGRLAWETQWVEGKLHGVTRGYRENRKLKEETTWVNGKLHGPARWYDDKGKLLREILYEDGKDPAAPVEAQEQDASAGQDKAPEKSPQAADAPRAADAPQP
jgi:hypothetical protein